MSFSATCKSRKIRLTLTWHKPSKSWKKYDGKATPPTKYFHHPDTEDGYQKAVVEMAKWKQSLRDDRPGADDYRSSLDIFTDCLAWYDRFSVPDGEEDQAVKMREFVERLQTALDSNADSFPPIKRGDYPIPMVLRIFQAGSKLFKDGTPKAIQAAKDGVENHVFEEPEAYWGIPDSWDERLRNLRLLTDKTRKTPQTVRHWLDAYLGWKADQVEANELKAKTLHSARVCCEDVVKFVGDGTHVSLLDSDHLTNLYRHLLKLKIGPVTRKNRFNAWRTFLTWMGDQDRAEFTIPRNIRSKQFRFTTHVDDTGRKRTAHSPADLWTVADFKKGLELPAPWNVWVALCLNCGFTQSDLNELRPDEIDLENGRLIRQRTKTRRTLHPPIINYKLWPQTVKLLRPFVSLDREFVFYTSTGGRLKVEGTKTKRTGKPGAPPARTATAWLLIVVAEA